MACATVTLAVAQAVPASAQGNSASTAVLSFDYDVGVAMSLVNVREEVELTLPRGTRFPSVGNCFAWRLENLSANTVVLNFLVTLQDPTATTTKNVIILKPAGQIGSIWDLTQFNATQFEAIATGAASTIRVTLLCS